MKKSVWIFLLAVFLPGAVLGWLALRGVEEQQIIFERRTAELYQKETDSLAAAVRDAVEAERRAFGDAVHRLLVRNDGMELGADFTNSLADVWPRKAIGFALTKEGNMLSPTMKGAAENAKWRDFLWNNGSWLCSVQPAVVYRVPIENARYTMGNSSWAASNGLIANAGKSQEPVQLPQQGEMIALQEQKKLQEKTAGDGDISTSADAAAGKLVLAMPKGGTPEQPATVSPTKSKGRKGPSTTDEAPAVLAIPESLPALKPAASAAPMAPAARPVPTPSAPAPVVVASPSTPAPFEKSSAREQKGSGGNPMPVAPPAPGPSAAAPTVPRPAAGAGLAGRRNSEDMSKGLKVEGGAAGGESAYFSRDAANEMQPSAPVAKAKSSEPIETRPPAETAKESLTTSAPKAMIAKKMQDGEMRMRMGAPLAIQDAKPALQAAEKAAESLDAKNREMKLAVGTQRSALEAAEKPLAEASPKNAPAAPINEDFQQRATVDHLRQVSPQQFLNAPTQAVSSLVPDTAEFKTITAMGDEGMVSRFVQDKLDLIFWMRPPEAPDMVFGCLVEVSDLSELWPTLLARHNGDGNGTQPAFVLALLNDKTKPIATLPAGISGRDWKRPFVASEIGEALPHWEAALYLATPGALAEGAAGLHRTLSFTVAAALALILIGAWLVVADIRRELALAQQKTDFVSNVSHELKTPLTSIRMFAELMHDRPQPVDKQGQYLRIITVEAERLTRLINNVLDFAKLERRQKRFDKRHIDFHEVIRRVWDCQEMHLRDAGFTTRWEAAPAPYPVLGDEDALSQVLVNLLSNAEKYSQERKEVELHSWVEDSWLHIAVLDRGMGVPAGEERKIFESFYRAHDSLSSGIQGSGLGLTLALRLAEEHGGRIEYSAREGGGSRFTLMLPLVPGERHDAPSAS